MSDIPETPKTPTPTQAKKRVRQETPQQQQEGAVGSDALLSDAIPSSDLGG